MILVLLGHSYHYELESLCDVFFPYEKVQVTSAMPEAPSEDIVVVTKAKVQDNTVHLAVTLTLDGNTTQAEETITLSQEEHPQDKKIALHLAVLLFRLLSSALDYTPKWGVLIGVRPIKLLRKLTAERGEEEALRYFTEELLVSPEKASLARTTMHNEDAILHTSRPNSFSLYVSIPFCPSRCSYCSFISSSVQQTAKLMPSYVALLKEELLATAEIAKRLNLRLETIYFGGGTPTTLSAEQLEALLATVHAAFDTTTCTELTVEAGRPDTITKEKLLALKAGGVTRISINPQSMHDSVLRSIGRRHTAQQVVEAFQLARECGLNNINMDVIAGLHKDTLESYCSTIDQLLALAPESITVHTLALKRSSDINQNGKLEFLNNAALCGKMLRYGEEQFALHGYMPYYLYRQSRMVGNLENVGWAKPGYESGYNVFIMDETHTILACGAGGVSKVRDPYSSRLQRVFNFKFPYEYRDRFPEILERKEKIVELYQEYGLDFT